MTAAQGFMGQPITAESPAAPARPKPSQLDYHFAYSLPASITDQWHWTGNEADLHYGLIEPSPAQLAEIGRDSSRQIKDIAVSFVRALGQLDSEGKLVREPDELDADGRVVRPGAPVLKPVGYLEVEAWYNRIGARGVQLVVGEFQRLFIPSNVEGEALRASRRRR